MQVPIIGAKWILAGIEIDFNHYFHVMFQIWAVSNGAFKPTSRDCILPRQRRVHVEEKVLISYRARVSKEQL